VPRNIPQRSHKVQPNNTPLLPHSVSIYTVIRAIYIFVFVIIGTAVYSQDDFYLRLAKAAAELTKDKVTYDAGYYNIKYPNGDIPKGKGVCTDVIIRAYRAVGIDLQKEVHEDMKANFSKYPAKYGLSHTDPNIDHRRVPNLMVFFARKGIVKPITLNSADYLPGDIVCWDLGNGITHIGLVVNSKLRGGTRHLIVHNIGGGQVYADCLFEFKIIGHYRYKK
jgi:uncharacterized protein